MTEIHVRSWLANLLLIAKLAIVFWMFFMWDTGGFNLQEVLETLTLIAPLLSVHLIVVFEYYLENRIKTDTKEEPLNAPTIYISILLPLVYVISLFVIINLKPQGKVSFAEMKIMLGTAETMFGVYLSMIIFAFFKTGRKSTQQDDFGNDESIS